MSTQMEQFGQALRDIANGRKPEKYNAPYVYELSAKLTETIPIDAPIWFWGKAGGVRILREQMKDCQAFGAFENPKLICSPIYKAFATGLLWEGGRQGPAAPSLDFPICGNCATRLSYVNDLRGACNPCPFCIPEPEE